MYRFSGISVVIRCRPHNSLCVPCTSCDANILLHTRSRQTAQWPVNTAI